MLVILRSYWSLDNCQLNITNLSFPWVRPPIAAFLPKIAQNKGLLDLLRNRDMELFVLLFLIEIFLALLKLILFLFFHHTLWGYIQYDDRI